MPKKRTDLRDLRLNGVDTLDSKCKRIGHARLMEKSGDWKCANTTSPLTVSRPTPECRTGRGYVPIRHATYRVRGNLYCAFQTGISAPSDSSVTITPTVTFRRILSSRRQRKEKTREVIRLHGPHKFRFPTSTKETICSTRRILPPLRLSVKHKIALIQMRLRSGHSMWPIEATPN